MKPTIKYYSSVTITQHACKRARERFRWNENTLQRMSEKAYTYGLESSNSSGYLKKYFEQLSHGYSSGSTIKLYGETIYIFYSYKLITMWQLPLFLRPLAKAMGCKIAKNNISQIN